jgi:hypothetical protein
MVAQYIAGLITAGFLVAGLFFLKYWARTRDFLFIAFAVAFWLLAANQAILSLAEIPREDRSWVYLLRLAAFTLIILAVIRKNLQAGRR